MQVILLIALAIIAIVVLFLLLKWVLKALKYAALLLLGIAAGVPALAGKLTHVAASRLRLGWVAAPVLVLAGTAAGLFLLLELDWEPRAFAFFTSACLALACIIGRAQCRQAIRHLAWHAPLQEQCDKYDFSAHVALWLAVTAFTLFLAAPHSPWEGPLALAAWGYWLGAAVVQAFSATRHTQLATLATTLERETPQRHGTPLASVAARMGRSCPTLAEEAPALVEQYVVFATLHGRLLEIELNGTRRLFCPHWYRARGSAISGALAAGVRYPEQAMADLVREHFGLEHRDGVDLLTHHLQLGQVYQFEDGHFFVAYHGAERVECCAGCGVARWLPAGRGEAAAGEWYCSGLCEQTQRMCLDIHRQAPESFINDALATGFTLMGGSTAWVDNHKIFATDGQGHGIGAEHANTMLDRLHGRAAAVVGGDDAKDGPDRLVEGRFLQSKYCSTGARSVGEAFNNKGDGMYRYYNPDDGAPMALEVPADQYHAAVKAMRRKISQGKVPTVTDPDQAESLVVRGRITYEQARNITRFGRIEGVAFDTAEGAVVGLRAASISFCIGSTLIYLRNGDARAAIEAAAWQAGKVGVKTTGAYVLTQQIHRIAPVQSLLDGIKVGGFPPTLREHLRHGMGVQSDNALKRALGGAAVSSVVAIGIATAPDLYRMIRREITLARLKRTVATATGGTVGALVGSVVGGAAGAPAGPLGIFVGRAAGGVLGGAAAAATVDWLFADQRHREEALANQRFQAHLAYLAHTFALTEKEVQVVVRNFLSMGGQDTQQKILAGKYEGRAYLNSLLKPLAVGVVKQRDVLELPLPHAPTAPAAAPGNPEISLRRPVAIH